MSARPGSSPRTKPPVPQLAAVIHSLLKGLRLISGLIYPVMPETAARMQKHLGLDPDGPFYLLEHLRLWQAVPAGTHLPKPVMLFPRIETESEPEAGAGPAAATAPAAPAVKPEIGIDDFRTVDLRVATVLHAEPVPKAKKLLKLEIDMGERRTLVAGIAEHYTPGVPDRAADHRGRQPQARQAHGRPVPGHAARGGRRCRAGAGHARPAR